MNCIHLPTDVQRLTHYLKILHIFVRKRSYAHIRDSHAVSFAYLYKVSVYLYISSVCSHILISPCAHPLLTVSTTYSRVSEETPPTVCTRLAALVHTPFPLPAFRPLCIVYIYNKVPVTKHSPSMKWRGNRNVGIITVGCKG